MQVLNHSALKGKIPPRAIYIGRNPEIWRNFGGQGRPAWGNDFHIGRDGDRNKVCNDHEAWLEKELKDPKFRERFIQTFANADAVVCHCAPQRCHGDNIKKALERLIGPKQSARAASAAISSARLEGALNTLLGNPSSEAKKEAFELAVLRGDLAAIHPSEFDHLLNMTRANIPGLFQHPYFKDPKSDPYMKSGALDAMGRAFLSAHTGKVWGRLPAEARDAYRMSLHVALRAALDHIGQDPKAAPLGPPDSATVAVAVKQYLLALSGPGADARITPAEATKLSQAMHVALMSAYKHHADMLRQQPGPAASEEPKAAAAPARPAPSQASAPASAQGQLFADAAKDKDSDAVHVAIIGTAGRREDGPRITKPLYEAMVANARETVRKLGGKDKVIAVSGGAAVADHVAVRLFLEGELKGLKLFLPAEFVPGTQGRSGQFAENPHDYKSAGNIANYYHRQFKQRTGVDGLAEIARALAMPGCTVVVKPGFKERNTLVADIGNVVLAYTFGPGKTIAEAARGETGHANPEAAGLKDGGTADTWSKARNAERKIHVPLHLLEREVARDPSFRGAQAQRSGGFER